jgi:hypothetical protein
MIYLYLFTPSFEELRMKCTIDMSRIPADQLADECDNVLQHHSVCSIFLGYLDVGWMLDPRHEARIRCVLRKFDVYLVTFHLESLPFSWKNEINTVYIPELKDGPAETINDGRTLQTESQTKD